jgi:methyl-accepting chemotaxis protein
MEAISLFKRSEKNSANPDTSVSNEDMQQLITCLKECDLTKPIPLELSSKPLAQMVSHFNQAIMTGQKSTMASTLDINHAVGCMTNMNCIREMLHNMQEQTNQLSSMAAQAEQMGAASTEIASAASSAATSVEASVQTATQGTAQIKNALEVVEHSFTEFEKVADQVQEVLNSMGEIEQIMEVIAGVADQTNLLALNAAIEAARAGEHGRGFAVVADEVRKLAEDTKNSVENIKGKITYLSKNSHQAAESIAFLAKRMENGRSTMQGADKAVEQIMEQVQSIASDINMIASGSEEQSASVQEFTSGITTVADAAQVTRDLAEQTGEGIYRISQELGRIRLDHIAKISDFENHQALELSKTDHLLWTWRIYNMLLGYEQVDPNNVGKHHDCRLGKWADGPEADSFRNHPLFLKLEEPHKLVHEYAREAALAFQAKDIAKAEELLRAMSQASCEVVEILEGLQKLA